MEETSTPQSNLNPNKDKTVLTILIASISVICILLLMLLFVILLIFRNTSSQCYLPEGCGITYPMRSMMDKVYNRTQTKRIEIKKYVCPETEWVGCMPMVPKDRQWQCESDYLNWAQKNCPGFKGAAY